MSYTPTNWNTGDTITAAAMNKIENGIANAGGGKYDAYNYIISQVDNGTPVLEKGEWSDIYDALQAKTHVVGLYLWNQTPNQYHDTVSMFVPLTYTNYYSSADTHYGCAIYDENGNTRRVVVEWESNGTITVNKTNI